MQKFELDLFQPTSKMTGNEFTIEGLLTLEEVGKAVENGYKVLVEELSSKRARAGTETVGFDDWVQATEARLTQDTREPARRTGYLSARGIESALQHLVKNYKSMSELIILPERSHERRLSRAVKISKGKGSRKSVLFIGGVHARELINPDMLVTFGLSLCQAYKNGTGLTFGSKSYDSATIKNIVETLDVFIFPVGEP